MICTFYDAYFGKVFEADLGDVIQKTKQFNKEFINRGYVFAREYLKYLEDLSGMESEYCPSDYLLDNFGFKTTKDDLIELTPGLLDDKAIVVIRPRTC